MPSSPRRCYKDFFPGWIVIYEEWTQNELQLVCEEQLPGARSCIVSLFPGSEVDRLPHFLPGPLSFLTCERALTSDHARMDTCGWKECSGSPAEKASLLLAAAVTTEQAKFLGILSLLFSKVIWASGCTFGPFPPFLFTCHGEKKIGIWLVLHTAAALWPLPGGWNILIKTCDKILMKTQQLTRFWHNYLDRSLIHFLFVPEFPHPWAQIHFTKWQKWLGKTHHKKM